MRLTQKIVDSALYEGRSYKSKSGRKRWSQHVLWDEESPIGRPGWPDLAFWTASMDNARIALAI